MDFLQKTIHFQEAMKKINELLEFYATAKQEVISLGYTSEIAWQESQSPETINESMFLQETAWVIYCSGFREETVRNYFSHISLCFCDWESAKEICSNKDKCLYTAMSVFRNKRKHYAVASVAELVATSGFSYFKTNLLNNPIETLRQLPFIGTVTSYHLAKNLGFDVAKPDRHLERLKKHFGYHSVGALCSDISSYYDDSIRVIDIVLWRYLERSSTKGKKVIWV